VTARVLLFTGKGGVGKTTTAAATALACADLGLRTIVLSTDPAHSLGDALDVELGPLAVEVAPNLHGQQLDAQDRMEDSWVEIQAYLQDVFHWAGVEGLEAEELAVVPGLDEVFALADIRQHASSGEWDVVVVDCAPTAETIRLLSLPDVLSRYMERLFPVGRRVSRVVSPVLSRVTTLPVAGDRVFDATQRFYDRLHGVREILTDGSRTSVRLVVNPERMVIAEARRTFTYLSLFGYHVDAVVANRVLPAGAADPFLARWRALHEEHLGTIRASFDPLPVLEVPWQPEEPVGAPALRVVAQALHGGDDPTARLAEGRPLRARSRGDGYVLEIELPFTARDEVDLARRADELLVRVGPYRRAVTLPDTLRRRSVTGAQLTAGRLEVEFGRNGTSGISGISGTSGSDGKDET
jgi:arsenite-transporting ATPase